MKVKEGGSIRIITIKFDNNYRNVLISGLAFGIIQPLDVFVIMERLGLAKEKAQWFAAAEKIGMLIGGGIAVVVTVFLERHTKIMMTVCLLNFCYDNTVRSTIS